MEHHLASSWFQPLHHHRRARQRAMSAQGHFHARREPADPVIVTVAHQERGLGQIVLVGQRQHGRVARKFRQRHDGGGIAFEAARGKRVELENGCAHWFEHPAVTQARRQISSLRTARATNLSGSISVLPWRPMEQNGQ